MAGSLEMLHADTRRPHHRRDQKRPGMVVHTHDCHVPARGAALQTIGWTWPGQNINKLFEVSIKLIVANQRGVLAKVATAIADAESNIENVHFSNEGDYTRCTLPCRSTIACTANVMRNLRLIPEVVRITRIKNIQQLLGSNQGRSNSSNLHQRPLPD
jgi:GTP pyrophosphokinase